MAATNNFDALSLFYEIAKEFKQDISLLGAISGSTLLGLGLAQIPAGIIAAKYRPRVAAIAGASAISVGACLTGFSQNGLEVMALRFAIGSGWAFFLPAAIVLASESARSGKQGMVVGFISASNAAGGMVGLIAMVIVSQLVGWHQRFSSEAFWESQVPP